MVCLKSEMNSLENNTDRLSEHADTLIWRGTLLSPASQHNGRNPTCGDEIQISILVRENVVDDIRFDGCGCVVSQACASMLCEGVFRKEVSAIMASSPEELMQFCLSGFSVNRQQCALLAYETLMRGLRTLKQHSVERSETA